MTRLYHFTLGLLLVSILSGCSIFPDQVTLRNTGQQEFSIEDKPYTLSVTATAYTSRVSETDSTPFLAAWNNQLHPNMQSIAVSRDLLLLGLTNGTKVRIDGLSGTFKVLDKMNKRWKNKIDIYMGINLKKAIQWGKRKVTIHWTRKSIEPLKNTKKKYYTYKKRYNTLKMK